MTRFAGDGLARVVVTHENITARKLAELERERLLASAQAARERAEEANRLKDEFLAVVSHELRTPLNAIVGWIRLLSDGRLDGDAARQAIETIERNARAQTLLVEDLLDVSRIMTGQLRIERRPVRVSHIVGAALDAVRPVAEARQVSLVTMPIAGEEPGAVAGDATRLQQVVWNLLSNAIKFTPAGGQVEVAIARRGAMIEIEVRDNGIGIDPEFLPYVFDRFRQADSSTTRAYGGLGLGLAIVRHVVELHGGSVRAKSEGKGRGATFTVHLPQAIAHRESTEQTE
jgi:signal transduction histidine kinase